MRRQFELEERNILSYARRRFALKSRQWIFTAVPREGTTERRKDNITEIKPDQSSPTEACACYNQPDLNLPIFRYLGLDQHFASIALLICPICGQHWLAYSYELEAFTASGRWYLGAIDSAQALHLTAEQAQAVLEGLDWYFYGGSYFGGRSGRSSGPLSVP